MTINKSKHLNCVLQSHSMKHIYTLMKKYENKRKDIKEALENHYGANIYSPINSGSHAKNVAINTKFDLDIVIPFKYNSVTSLEKMYDSIYQYFNKTYRKKEPNIKIKKQDVSINLIFGKGKKELTIDIVPGREIQNGSYKINKNLHLHFNISKRSSIQTNIEKQINHIKGRSAERDCIKLLKIWKTQKNRKYKSFFLELLVIRAFEQARNQNKATPKTKWEELKLVLEYIRDNVESIRLKDVGNKSNILSDTLEVSHKKELSREMKNMLNKINHNPNSIKNYFPKNPSYPC